MAYRAKDIFYRDVHTTTDVLKRVAYLIIFGLFAGVLSAWWSYSAIFALFQFGVGGGHFLDIAFACVPLCSAIMGTALLVRLLHGSWLRGIAAGAVAHLFGMLLILFIDPLWPLSIVVFCIVSMLFIIEKRFWSHLRYAFVWVSAALVICVLAWGQMNDVALLPGLAAWMILPALFWFLDWRQRANPIV